MSKTLIGIFETVAGVALEFVPGGQAIGTSSILAGVTTVASVLLEPHSKPDTTETAIKKPIPERVSAYGRQRASGGYIL